MRNKRLTVSVLPTDIKRGNYGSHASCPIALAVRRALKSPWIRVSVGNFRALIDGVEVSLPLKAQDFINKFDGSRSRSENQPISFTLSVPQIVWSKLTKE